MPGQTGGKLVSRMTEIPKDFSCPFVECAQFRYCTTKICSRWEAWFTDTWSKIHKQGLDAIERRKTHEHPQSSGSRALLDRQNPRVEIEITRVEG